MKTIILPGFSPHNRVWAEETAKSISLGHKVLVHNWLHWKIGGGLKLRQELQNILKEVGSSEVNIIAKSAGTLVASKLIAISELKVKKIIFCGIPSVSDIRKNIMEKALENFPYQNVICLQNKNDPFTSFDEVKKFMSEINPKVKVIRKPRSDHDYPYFEDFQKFLSKLSGVS